MDAGDFNPTELVLPDWWLSLDNDFPQPDWRRVFEWVKNEFSGSALCDAVEVTIGRRWVRALCERFGESYGVRESMNFMLVSVAGDQKQRELLAYLEQCYAQIIEMLPCLIEEEPKGKCPVLVIADQYLFYEYLHDFTGPGYEESAAVGGVFLNRGWGHFAVPSPDLQEYRNVFSHELCHALLSPLRLPLWLDEAVTMTVEDGVTGTNPYILDREIIEEHQGYWNRERILGFWSGESFFYNDDGQGLSYHLAQFILNALYQGGETPAECINEFILAAGGSADAGFGAAREILGFEIGELLEHFLGSGDWSPDHSPMQ